MELVKFKDSATSVIKVLMELAISWITLFCSSYSLVIEITSLLSFASLDSNASKLGAGLPVSLAIFACNKAFCFAILLSLSVTSPFGPVPLKSIPDGFSFCNLSLKSSIFPALSFSSIWLIASTSCGTLSAKWFNFWLNFCFSSTESILEKLDELSCDCTLLIFVFNISISFKDLCWVALTFLSESSASIAANRIFFSWIFFFKSSIDSLVEKALEFGLDTSSSFEVLLLCLELETYPIESSSFL